MAAAEPTDVQALPHSRACGLRQHPHGAQCAVDCPTCARYSRGPALNPSQPPVRPVAAAGVPAVYGPYPAAVTKIHDGDTVTLDIDLGFGVHQQSLSCRVFGINAPELATDAGKAALAYALTLLHIGDRVTVLSHGWDKYGGRFDGTIILPDGSDFGTLMLVAGCAVAMRNLAP